jgi:hypothetical protein
LTVAVHHSIVSVAGERQRWELPFHPFIKHIVQKQIRQDWTHAAALGRPSLACDEHAIGLLKRCRQPAFDV